MDEEKLVVQYHKKRYGDIAQFYKKEDIEKYFYFVINKLKLRYPEYIDEHKDFDLITSVGTVVSMSLIGKEGLYNSIDKNIGINHFLNRITTAFFHECVHKLGDLKSKKDFDKLPRIYKEIGTELVTIEALKKNDGVGFLFDDVWGVLPNTSTSYKPEIILLKQLGTLISSEALEKSVLQGTNEFSEEMISKVGDEKFEQITKKLEKFSDKYFQYKRFFGLEKQEKTDKKKQDLKEMIDDLQQEIFDLKFGKRIENVNDVNDAKNILDEMLQFSNLRFRNYFNASFHDDKFEECFLNTINVFKSRFNDFEYDKKFDVNSWQKEYKIIPDVVQISEEEKKMIEYKAKMLQKKYEPNFLKKLFRKKDDSVLMLPSTTIQKESIFEETGFKFSLNFTGSKINDSNQQNMDDKSQDVK